MQKTLCDICKEEITIPGDNRYINITKIVDGKDIPCTPEREACVHCTDKFKKVLLKLERSS